MEDEKNSFKEQLEEEEETKRNLEKQISILQQQVQSASHKPMTFERKRWCRSVLKEVKSKCRVDL